jgi:hypothetical protein
MGKRMEAWFQREGMRGAYCGRKGWEGGTTSGLVSAGKGGMRGEERTKGMHMDGNDNGSLIAAGGDAGGMIAEGGTRH